MNNNPTKIHPVASSQQNILNVNLRNDTPFRNGPNQDQLGGVGTGTNQGVLIGMNASGNTGQAVNPTGGGGGGGGGNNGGVTARREDLIIDTNTNQNVGNTHAQLSPVSNKSYLKISGYVAIESYKKSFAQTIEFINNTRLVEVLGGLASVDEKTKAIKQFGMIWQEMLGILMSIEEKICLMSFESDILYPNSEQFISDLVVNSVKEIESQYINLITGSSLRFLDTVCTVHDLQYKHVINLRFDIRQWRKNNLDHVKQSQPLGRRGSTFTQSYDKNGNLIGGRQNKSLMQSICCCCMPSNNKSMVSSQQLLRKQSSQDQAGKKLANKP